MMTDTRNKEGGVREARYGPASTEQVLGALPVVAGFCRRLDIAGIIDRAAPVREIAYATHGQVIEALIANRLTSPSPMIHVGAWARQFAVEHALGLDPGVLNDDRIARALDALAPVAEQVTGSVGAAAIGAYGIDVSQLHWDMTSISLYGDYPACDTDFPQPKFGHPKDRRPDLKQIQAGVATAADGAVPVFWAPYSGGAGEVAQVVGAMEALRRLAGPRRFLLVGDSKLLSYNNIAAMIGARVDFLAPASKPFVPAAVLAGCDYAAATPVPYVAARDTTRPARTTWPLPRRRGHHDHHRAPQEEPIVHHAPGVRLLLGPRRRRRYRPHQETRPRPRRPGPAHPRTRLAPLPDPRESHRQGHHHRRPSPRRRLPAHNHRHRPQPTTNPRLALRPSRHRRRGRHRRLVRAADQPARHGHRRDVLARYKNQPATSERRYHDLKGPLAVAPMFLHTNRRIAALIGVLCLALLIYCLVEREARRNLAPATTLDGLYAGRPAKPTASLIFTALATLRLRTATTDRTPEITQPDALQLRLLDLLQIDPGARY